MKLAVLIEQRASDWKALEDDLNWVASQRGKRLDPQRLSEFARRYRAVCSDLAQATARRYPPGTIRYLHQLVAAAHAQLYRGETFHFRDWGKTLFVAVPRRILRDPCTWIAMALFWGLFLGSLARAWLDPDFAQQVVGRGVLANMESMYAQPLSERGSDEDARDVMAGFYVFNNAGIGLRCFASGLLLGVGSLCVMAFNAIVLGTIFGHMLLSDKSANFTEFVTAHGPFELTAVVLSTAAGLRLGWSMIDTRGLSRGAALRHTAPRALEIALAATVLFVLAAFIEGYISPSGLPYAFKAGVAIVSTLLLLGYVFALGWRGPARFEGGTFGAGRVDHET